MTKKPSSADASGAIPCDQMRELEQLASRMGRDSRWQVTEAAFRLGLRLGFQQGYAWAGQPDKEQSHGA
jgi:hypothetical protein